MLHYLLPDSGNYLVCFCYQICSQTAQLVEGRVCSPNERYFLPLLFSWPLLALFLVAAVADIQPAFSPSPVQPVVLLPLRAVVIFLGTLFASGHFPGV